MIWNNIWLSSTEHMSGFHETIGKTPKFLLPLLGVWRMRKDFPHIRFLHYRLPIVYESIGTLRLEQDGIRFSSHKPSANSSVDYRNLKQADVWIAFDEIEKLDSYQSEKTYFGSRNFPWIKLALKNGQNLLFSAELKNHDFENGLAITDHISKTLRKHLPS